MSIRTILAASCTVVALQSALPAFAQDKALAITIYADDLALVQDKRPVEVTGGRQRIEFAGVSAQIRPETVSLSANGVTIGWNQVSGSFTDIFIRVRSVANSTLELGNLSLTTGGPAFNVGTISSTGAEPAEYLRVQNDGQAIPAFTLSGTHRLSWTSQTAPGGSNLAYQVKFSNVVPTPGAMAVLGLGGLVATRRRRA
jgi:hypothetical protein